MAFFFLFFFFWSTLGLDPGTSLSYPLFKLLKLRSIIFTVFNIEISDFLRKFALDILKLSKIFCLFLFFNYKTNKTYSQLSL